MKTSSPVRCSLWSLLFSSFLPAATQAGTPYFDARFRAFETSGSGGIVVADLNKDGLPDVLMGCEGGVGVLQGRSDGDLGPFVLWPTGAWAYDVAVGDLDIDGNLDCVIVDQDNQVSTMFGRGDGTFQPSQVVATTNNYPSAVGIGYINHDPRPDIIFANYYSHTLSVMLQNLDGSFAAPIISPSGGFVSNLIVRDMDLDKKADIVYQGNLGYAVVYGNGDGTFGTIDFWDPPNHPRGIAVADLNDDQRPDLVVSDIPGVFVRLGGPLRTFGNPVAYSIGDVGNSVTVGDATGDGNLDILVCTNNKNSIALLQGFGNGTFGPYSLHSAGESPGSIGVVDFTQDGIIDLVSSDANGQAILLHEGNGNNTFGHVEGYPTAATPIAMVLEDLNKDLRPDVIYSTGYGPAQSPRIWIRLMQANGVPGPLDYYNCDLEPISLASSDFNNDTYPDLAAAAFYDSTFWVWLNNGSGALGSPIDLSIHLDLMVSGDFNEDGAADLLGLNLWEPSAPLNFIRGNGDGTFDAAIGMQAPSSIGAMIAGDVNEDSHLDIVYTHYSGSVSLWLGNGAGQFSHHATLAAGNQPFQTILADLDLDDCPDLVTSNYQGGTVSIFRGHCDGTFDPSIPVDVGTYPKGMVSGDLDGDPYPDLAVINGGGNTISLLRGNGSFDFLRTDLGAGNQPTVIAAGDLKQLGKQDLVILCVPEISILRNNGPTTVGVGEIPDTGPKARLRNAPNPFDASTTLSFAMPQEGRLRITIHDIQGRMVRELTDQLLPAGEYNIVWDGKDHNGVSVVPGLYLARLDAPNTRLTQKMFRISRH